MYKNIFVLFLVVFGAFIIAPTALCKIDTSIPHLIADHYEANGAGNLYPNIFNHQWNQLRTAVEFLFFTSSSHKSLSPKLIRPGQEKPLAPRSHHPEIYPEERQTYNMPISKPLETNTTTFNELKLRNLANTTVCKNSGIQMNVTQQRFYCNGTRVTDVYYYMSIAEYGNMSNCTTKNKTIAVCYCSADYDGADCRYKIKASCTLAIFSPEGFNGCSNNTDSDYYMYSIPGDDPCVFANRSERLNVTALMNCSLPEGSTESIGGDLPNILTVVNTTKNHFNYTIDTPYMKSVDNLTVMLYFNYANFVWLSKQITDLLTTDEGPIITGQENFTMSLNLPALGDEYFIGGRLYYEYYIQSDGAYGPIISGFIEDKYYKEPPFVQTTIFEWYWFPIAGAVILIIGISAFVWYKKKKERELKEKLT